MAWNKRQILADMFGELRLAGFDFDVTAEEQQAAARRLEMMMAAWSGRGLHLGYVFAADPAAIDLDEDSGLALVNVRAVVCNLAMDRAASVGKQVHPQTMRAASDGMRDLLAAAAMPPRQQLPSSLPRGAGAKGFGYLPSPFMPAADRSPLTPAETGGLDFKG